MWGFWLFLVLPSARHPISVTFPACTGMQFGRVQTGFSSVHRQPQMVSCNQWEDSEEHVAPFCSHSILHQHSEFQVQLGKSALTLEDIPLSYYFRMLTLSCPKTLSIFFYHIYSGADIMTEVISNAGDLASKVNWHIIHKVKTLQHHTQREVLRRQICLAWENMLSEF